MRSLCQKCAIVQSGKTCGCMSIPSAVFHILIMLVQLWQLLSPVGELAVGVRAGEIRCIPSNQQWKDVIDHLTQTTVSKRGIEGSVYSIDCNSNLKQTAQPYSFQQYKKYVTSKGSTIFYTCLSILSFWVEISSETGTYDDMLVLACS